MKNAVWVKIRRNAKFFFDLISSDKLKTNLLQAFPFWIASLITGLVAVGYSKTFVYSEQIMKSIFHWHQWLIFILTPFCFIIAWWIIQQFAPNARGSGIPQVMAAIELATPKHNDKADKLLGFRIIIVKIISSLMMVLGGGAIGREGPTIQIAGSIFRIVNKLIPKTWPKLSKQSFIMTGAAAGLAAAFNTPLGGVVFAVEELAKIHIRFFRTALFSAVIIAGLTAQGFLGPYLYLGYPDVSNLKFSIFFGVIATAILGGLGGSLMSKATLKVMRWRSSLKRTSQVLLYVFLAALVVAAIAFFINERILGSGKDLMTTVLFSNQKYESWDTALMRIGGITIAFSTGAAGGVFAPSLAAGASIGAFVAGLFHVLGSNANILILSGMVGFLTGVTRTPFTSAILVLEMTDRHNVIFHLMLAAMFSHLVSTLIDKHSFYDHLKKQYFNDALAEKEEVEEPQAEVVNRES
jgi:H+/Cl- antiporter ClcA